MTRNTKPFIAVFILTAVLTLATSNSKAQTPATSPSVGQGERLSEGSSKESGKSDMMDKMDMNEMTGMMHECMEMKKNGKMCEHQTMEKCEEKMGKGECHKMMKDVKKSEKKSKTK